MEEQVSFVDLPETVSGHGMDDIAGPSEAERRKMSLEEVSKPFIVTTWSGLCSCLLRLYVIQIELFFFFFFFFFIGLSSL